MQKLEEKNKATNKALTNLGVNYSAKLIFSSILLFLFLFTNVSSAPAPFIQNVDTEGYQLLIPEIGTIKQGQSYTLRIHILNKSNGYPIDTNDSVSCYLDIYSPQGIELYSEKLGFENSSTGGEWYVEIGGAYFIDIGVYSYIPRCYDPVAIIGGGESIGLEVAGGNMWLFLIGFVLFYGLTFMGIKIRNPWVSLLGCFGMAILGIYTSFNGIDIYKNALTSVISYVTIAIGLGIGFESLMEISEL